jgi:endonuclease/exonuclease/phosphatase family metal-dependent hydrolase
MSLEQVELGSFAPQEGFSDPPRAIRVVNWNIARGSRFDEIADFLASSNADLIILQEVDSRARRTSYRNIGDQLAQKLRLNYAFGIEFQELSQGSRHEAAYHGQATLSRWPITDCRVLRFRNQSSFWCPKRWIPALALFQRRLGGRIAVVTHISIGEKTLVIYNLHLESRNGDDLRRSQLLEVLNDTLQYGRDMPVIVAGDFNFDLGEARNAALAREMQFDNPFAHLCLQTAESPWPGHRTAIDWILARGPLKPVSPEVHDSIAASDHYPLSLNIELTSNF